MTSTFRVFWNKDMKKIGLCLMIAALLLLFAGCGNKTNLPGTAGENMLTGAADDAGGPAVTDTPEVSSAPEIPDDGQPRTDEAGTEGTPDNDVNEDKASDESDKEQAPDTEPSPEATPAPHVYTDKIVFSISDVFCATSSAVSIVYDCVSPAAVYYTLDGTIPNKNSTLYDEPVFLEASETDEPNIYMLRAIAYTEDGSASAVATHSYFVGGQIETRYSTAVFSIVGDPKNFYDPEYGILSYAHRYGHGEKYERDVYVTAVRADGSLIFEQDCGIRLIGGDSREYPRPSLKLYARKSYTPDRGYFPFDLFEVPRVDKPWKNVEKYGRLVLRINGDDSQNTMMRDVLLQRLAGKMGFVDYEAAVPAVVYINGEYYSLIWVRECYNNEYFRRKYGERDGEFVTVEAEDMVKYYKASSSELERKAVNEFNRMYNKYAYSDLTKDETYAELCKLMDVEDYLRYFAVELYAANTDWPNNNLYAFRYYPNEGAETGEGVFDGRWRFLLHDLDYSSGIWNAAAGNPPSHNTWKNVTTPGHSRYSPLFTALMKRSDCRKYFVNFTTKMIAEAFSPESVRETIEELCASRDGELPYYFRSVEELRKMYQRGESNYPIYFNDAVLKKNIENLISFFNKRPEYALKYINELE